MPRQPPHEALAVHHLQSNVGDEEDETGVGGHADEAIMQDQQQDIEGDGYGASLDSFSQVR